MTKSLKRKNVHLKPVQIENRCSDEWGGSLLLLLSSSSLCKFTLYILYFAFLFSLSSPEFVPFFCSLFFFPLGCWGQHNCIFVHKLLHFKHNTVVNKIHLCGLVFSLRVDLQLLMKLSLAVQTFAASSVLSHLIFSASALFCFIFRATLTLWQVWPTFSFFILVLMILPLCMSTPTCRYLRLLYTRMTYKCLSTLFCLSYSSVLITWVIFDLRVFYWTYLQQIDWMKKEMSSDSFAP